MSGVLIDGGLVHYEIFGRGKPLVLVHGWLGSWRYWVPVMDELSADYRTYALDLWGFGDSDKSRDRYELDSYVDLLVAFMDDLGLWRVPMVGHTLGAAVSAKLAVAHPDRVSKIMTIGLPLGSEGINRKLLAAGPNDSLGRLFWNRQKPYSEVESGAPKSAPNIVARTIQQVAELDMHDLLDDIDIPVLTLYGGKDNVIDPGQADKVDEEHSGARSIVLPGTRHFPMLDETATFTRLLRDFMDIEGPDELRELAVKKEWRRRTR
jgi:pimeloyl-ACP methyl ester carboxylesterase